jgi:hypothetical protein
MRAPARLVLCALALGTAACLTGSASASSCRVDVNADVTTPVATAHVSRWYDAGIHDGTVGEEHSSVQVLGLPPLTSDATETQSPGSGVVEAVTGIWVPGLVCS